MAVVLRELPSEFVQPDVANHALPVTDRTHTLVDGLVLVAVEHRDGCRSCRSELGFVFSAFCFERLDAVDDLAEPVRLQSVESRCSAQSQASLSTVNTP